MFASIFKIREYEVSLTPAAILMARIAYGKPRLRRPSLILVIALLNSNVRRRAAMQRHQNEKTEAEG